MGQAAILPDARRLQDALDDVLAATGVPGGVLTVRTGNGAVTAAGGLANTAEGAAMTRRSRFEISCLMKFFVALIMLELAERGTLDVDAPVAAYLPEFAGEADGKAARIAIRHLLSHTSGYHGLDVTDMRIRWNFGWRQFAAHFRSAPQFFAPGAVFNYEHSEHVILGRILHRVTGKSAGNLLAAIVLAPLDLDHGSAKSGDAVASHGLKPQTQHYAPVAIPPFAAFWEASLPDLTMTPEAIATVAEALLRGTAPFSRATLDRLREPVIAIPHGVASDARSERLPSLFGLGCAHYAGGWLGHNGSMLGQTCGLRLHPERGAVIVAGVNAWSPHARDLLLRRAAEAIEGHDAEADDAPADAAFAWSRIADGFAADDLVGRYAGSYLGSVTVARDGDALQCDAGPGGARRQAFRVVPDGDGRHRLESRAPISVAFQPAPGTGEPVLFLGVHAYKREARARS